MALAFVEAGREKEQAEATSTAKLSHSGDHKYTHGLATYEAWPN